MALLISMKVTTMLRHYDQEERHTDGSRYWDSITSVLVRKFAHEGARDFDDEKWLQMILDGSSKKRIEYCKNRDGTRYCLRAIQGHSGGIPINPTLMNYVFYPLHVERVRISQRTLMELSVHFGKKDQF